MTNIEPSGTRRVVAGADADGRSTVLRDGLTSARTVRPNGAVVDEIWRQERVPAQVSDSGIRKGEMEPMPPKQGATVRMFTLPPDVDPIDGVRSALAGTFGEENVGRSADGITLHRTDSMYVATVVTGEAILVLETCEVRLGVGDCLVLPGCMHAWRNDTARPAQIVTVVFALDIPETAG